MHDFFIRFRLSLLAVISSILLSGCSFSFVYNNLDWWVNWYLDDYVVLDKAQQEKFDNSFERLHHWHRQTQLIRYAEQLKLLKQQVNDGISAEQLSEHLKGMNSHWVNVREQAKPDLIELTYLLSSEQRTELIESLEERNKEIIEEREERTREEWVKQECISQQKEFREWVGKLTKTQKNTICEMSGEFQSTFDYWIGYRKLWLQGFTESLDTNIDKSMYQQLFAELIANPEKLRSDEYNQVREKNNQAFANIFHYMMNNLTQKQLKRFNKRLQNYIDDFIELSED